MDINNFFILPERAFTHGQARVGRRAIDAKILNFTVQSAGWFLPWC